MLLPAAVIVNSCRIQITWEIIFVVRMLKNIKNKIKSKNKQTNKQTNKIKNKNKQKQKITGGKVAFPTVIS